MSLNLGLVPLILFLLYATREDAEWLSIRPRTVGVWGAVALAGWGISAWPLHGWAALACCGLLAVAGVGAGDRWGGLLVGGLMGTAGSTAVGLALVLALGYCWRGRRAPAAVPFYPFLSASVGAIIVVQGLLGSLA